MENKLTKLKLTNKEINTKSNGSCWPGPNSMFLCKGWLIEQNILLLHIMKIYFKTLIAFYFSIWKKKLFYTWKSIFTLNIHIYVYCYYKYFNFVTIMYRFRLPNVRRNFGYWWCSISYLNWPQRKLEIAIFDVMKSIFWNGRSGASSSCAGLVICQMESRYRLRNVWTCEQCAQHHQLLAAIIPEWKRNMWIIIIGLSEDWFIMGNLFN